MPRNRYTRQVHADQEQQQAEREEALRKIAQALKTGDPTPVTPPVAG